MNITVTSVNDVPVVANDTIPLAKDGFYGIRLSNRSSDADGDRLIATLLTSTQNGVLVFDGGQHQCTSPNQLHRRARRWWVCRRLRQGIRTVDGLL